MLDPTAARIVDFLTGIGLTVSLTPLPPGTFLPGVTLAPGGLLVDPARLLYPGDLLHEAGHLAVMPPVRRNASDPSAGIDLGEEIAAQCWSYAAALHLGIAPEAVFHPAGYRGSSASLIETYANGSAGVPLLQWMGLALDAKRAAETGQTPYPHMQRWLREQ